MRKPGDAPLLLIALSVTLLIVTSAYLRSLNAGERGLLPVPPEAPCEAPAEQVESGEPEVILFQASADDGPPCPTRRQQAVKRLRSLYRVHVQEVRCG